MTLGDRGQIVSPAGEPQLFGEVRSKKQNAPGSVGHQPGDRLGLAVDGPLNEAIFAAEMFGANDLKGIGSQANSLEIHEFAVNPLASEVGPEDGLLHGRVRSLIAGQDSPFRLPEVGGLRGLMAGDPGGGVKLEAGPREVSGHGSAGKGSRRGSGRKDGHGSEEGRQESDGDVEAFASPTDETVAQAIKPSQRVVH